MRSALLSILVPVVLPIGGLALLTPKAPSRGPGRVHAHDRGREGRPPVGHRRDDQVVRPQEDHRTALRHRPAATGSRPASAAALGVGQRIATTAPMAPAPAAGAAAAASIPAVPSTAAPSTAEASRPPGEASRPPGEAAATGGSRVASLDEALVRHIESALASTNGRIEGAQGAAALLGINPHTLRARMRKLGIDWQRFRSG